ncbi:hypothetical protein CDEST_10227 [Colletotrichum destructivum]|uniref:Uncharacterized protein n=1 Tax=Colletotrichum destructivum TaxID=34406 RepID=A0AAX4IQ77_9PEZI|nr:hypothetical protein CDEST_10227 [Colletotrichum destructivum]
MCDVPQSVRLTAGRDPIVSNPWNKHVYLPSNELPKGSQSAVRPGHNPTKEVSRRLNSTGRRDWSGSRWAHRRPVDPWQLSTEE